MKTCKCNSHTSECNTSTLYATINHRSFRGAEGIEMGCVRVGYLKIFSSPAFISTLTPFKSAVKLFCSKNTSSLALNANACVNGVFQCVWFPFCIAEFHISTAALTTTPHRHASWQPSMFPQSIGR